MREVNFFKGYQKEDTKRAAFNILAVKTFGLSFTLSNLDGGLAPPVAAYVKEMEGLYEQDYRKSLSVFLHVEKNLICLNQIKFFHTV